MQSTESASYTRVAILLHWMIALAIIFMLALGWTFDFFSGDMKSALIGLHKSIGITILLLSLVRLGWRITHRAPSLPAMMPLWEKGAAHTAHALLYVLMIGVPLSGWAMSSTGPHNIVLFGLVPWPQMPILPTLEDKKEIGHMLFSVHGKSAFVLAVLIAGHAAAALRHHFILRDDILLRIIPSSCRGFLNQWR